MKRKVLNISSMMYTYSMIVTQFSENDGIPSKDEIQTSHISVGFTVGPHYFKDIQSTFITILEIWLGGEKVQGFIKQTIDLSLFQEGYIKFIFNGQVEAKNYNSLTLVIDFSTNVYGNSPSRYVLGDNNLKNSRESGTESKTTISVKKSFKTESDLNTELVVEFDLRKSLIQNKIDGKYYFLDENFLRKAFRILIKDDCGEVKGKIKKPFNLESDLYVLIYRKGEFDKVEELKSKEENDILFPNAIGSSKVKAHGYFQLPMIEKGNYEIHLATCDKNLGKQFLFKGLINPTSNIPGLLLSNIPVSAKSHIQLNIDILGVI